MDDMDGWSVKSAQDLSQMMCEMTSPDVKECALRARSTHAVHLAIVEVNIVIGVVLGEVLVAHVVPFVVDAVVGLTPQSHRSCCYRRFRRNHFSKNFTLLEVYCFSIWASSVSHLFKLRWKSKIDFYFCPFQTLT